MFFIFLTMDGNHSAALRQAAAMLKREHGLDLQFVVYSATTLHNEEAFKRLSDDAARADFIFGAMLFGEEMVRPLQTILAQTPASVCIIASNPALIRCTRIGKFVLKPKVSDEPPGMLKRWMQKFMPMGGAGESKRQLALLRNLGKIMKYIPGKMRDVHTYIAVHDYWLNSSPENLYRMLCMLISRYLPGYSDKLPLEEPLHYPDTALYHPDAPAPFPDLDTYQRWRRQQNGRTPEWQGSVGLLSMRAVILSGNTVHLDALVRSLEARGIEARLGYSAGLDFRPAIEQFFTPNGKPQSAVQLLLNVAGFSLVGGMAESRPDEAREVLESLDVGYLDLIPLSFQRVEDWQRNEVGLTPLQVAMNVTIPELDGAAEPLVYGGPTADSDKFVALQPQIELVAERVKRRVGLSTKTNAEKKVAIVLFSFPPNLGNVGTAAYLDVFVSIHRLLTEMKQEGYQIELPATAETLRQEVVEGNSLLFGTDGNVGARLRLDDYRRLFPPYTEIEPIWGYAPGQLLNDGRDFYILGKQLGNVFIGIQPSFGYERDPMRLLMAKDASPHHGFAAFYTWIEHLFGADAVLHFGTHGALEFMPGKQAGMSAQCWPTRLLGSLPNFYYYSVNNPSEGTIAKRRGAATLISYMVPPLQQAGLYKGLRLLKDSVDGYRQRPSDALAEDIRAQAEKLGITIEEASLDTLPPGSDLTDNETYINVLAHELIKIEHRMIPMGLHVLGESPTEAVLVDVMALVAAFTRVSVAGRDKTLPPLPQLVAHGLGWNYQELQERLKIDAAAQECWDRIDLICREAMNLFVAAPRSPRLNTAEVDAYLHQVAKIQPGLLGKLWESLDDLLGRIVEEREMEGLLRALNGGYIPPSPGNDVVRNAGVVPTGRNLHGLDPYRVPTPAAHQTGAQLMREMLERLIREQGGLPETVAMILWGTDNLKSDCEGVAQVLALLGARAIPDELGKISDVELISLKELGRPRIDVVVTVSGIFRDLLHHQMNLLDKAVRLAAEAPEPEEWNFVRKHSLAHAAELNVPLDEAATRIFTNAPGQYGASINHLIESSNWEDDGELSETFVSRKCFAYGARGEWRNARAIMERSLSTVNAAFQNVDSFEIGINDVDHYYEYLGGVTKSVEKMSGQRPSVMVADAISLNGRLSSLQQMVRMESRAKLLNPKWYEAMLVHGYEGVREIETRVDNTYGWSATANAVEGWVYQDVAETFLLDEQMRERLGKANPHAAAAIARRLLEAESRGFWDASEEVIEQLRDIYGNLEDQLEGIYA